MKRRYLLPMGAIALLYAFDRFLLTPLTSSRLLAWHGADFLAGTLMMCLLNGLLELMRQQPLRRTWVISAFSLGCGLFWEVITPLYLPRSVGDPWDILSVWLGAMAMLAVWRLAKQ